MDLMKKCRDCGETKPVTGFYSSGKAGPNSVLARYQPYCKACSYKRTFQRWEKKREANRARREAEKASLPTDQKRCTQCLEWKPLNAFNKKGDRLRSQCKACQAAEKQGYTERNREKIRASSHAYYAANKEAVKERINRSIAANPEMYRQIHTNWKKANKDAVNASTHKRRAKLKGGGSYSALEWEAVKAAYDHCCLLCGRREPEIKLTVDHIIAVSEGGPNTADNLQPLCKSCNSKKHRKALDLRTSA